MDFDQPSRPVKIHGGFRGAKPPEEIFGFLPWNFDFPIEIFAFPIEILGFQVENSSVFLFANSSSIGIGAKPILERSAEKQPRKFSFRLPQGFPRPFLRSKLGADIYRYIDI